VLTCFVLPCSRSCMNLPWLSRSIPIHQRSTRLLIKHPNKTHSYQPLSSPHQIQSRLFLPCLPSQSPSPRHCRTLTRSSARLHSHRLPRRRQKSHSSPLHLTLQPPQSTAKTCTSPCINGVEATRIMQVSLRQPPRHSTDELTSLPQRAHTYTRVMPCLPWLTPRPHSCTTLSAALCERHVRRL